MKTHNVRDFINSSSEFFTILKQLPTIEGDGPWVAGGSVWKSIENIPLECDVDIFFKSAEQCERWFRTLVSLPYGHRIVSDLKTNQYNTSLKYHINHKGYNKTITLQLITFRFFNDIEALLGGFDFTACQFGFDGQSLYSGDTSLDDLRNREIIFNNVLDSVATGIHIEKYIKFGFKVPSTQRDRYDEIVKKTSAFKNTIPRPEPSSPFLARWGNVLAGEPAIVASPRPPVAVDDGDDYAYPRPSANNSGIDLSRITQMPTPPRPAITPNSMWTTGESPISINPTYYTSSPPASMESPGVSTRELDTSNNIIVTNVERVDVPIIPMDYVTTAGTDNRNTPGIRAASNNEIIVQQVVSTQNTQEGTVYAEYMPVCENSLS